MTKSRETLSARVVRELSQNIVSGRLSPGTKLDEFGLAIHFDTSRTPIREALRELSARGLLEIRPHRGAFVADISKDELLSRFELMAELEALCARMAAERIRPAEKTALEALHEEARAIVAGGDRAVYTAHNWAFHDAIYRATQNAPLHDAALAARKSVDAYRAAQFDLPPRMERSQAEHDAILRAILDGDAGTAEDLMKVHIVTVMRAVETYLAQATPHPL